MRTLAPFLVEYDTKELHDLSHDLARRARNGPLHRAHETAYESISEGLDNNPFLARKYGAAAALLLLKESDLTVLTVAFPLTSGYHEAGSAACFERLMKGRTAFSEIREYQETEFLMRALSGISEDETNALIDKMTSENWMVMLLSLFILMRDARMVDLLESLLKQQVQIPESRLGLLFTMVALHHKELALKTAHIISDLDESIRLEFLAPCKKHLDPQVTKQIVGLFYGEDMVVIEQNLSAYIQDQKATDALARAVSAYPFLLFGVEQTGPVQIKTSLKQLAKVLDKTNFKHGVEWVRQHLVTSSFIRTEVQLAVAEEIRISENCAEVSLLGALAFEWTNQEITLSCWTRIMKGPEWPGCFNEPYNFKFKTALCALKINDMIRQEYLITELIKRDFYTPVLIHCINTNDSRLLDLFEEAMQRYSIYSSIAGDLGIAFSKKESPVIFKACEIAFRFRYKSEKAAFVEGLVTNRPELRTEVINLVKPDK